ncbi:taste receptor type 2 member 40-like [Bufo bufo]|uniref:taste receptor type 2 member 40-like n=1 Tax=Bufo bufo TaxID=8384 RepID=UPI001ABE1C93|nr:taste receptor type 2 member 40-like [Bufo bufo]
MLQVQYLVLLIIDSLALVTYIPGNIFIIFKNIQDWIKNRKRSPFLQLILGVSGINIAQGLLKFASTFFMTTIESTFLRKVYMIVCLILTSCNLWFSTWLCIYYCLQTVQIKLKFYCSLQKTFHKMVPWLHTLSILVSLVMSIPFALKTSEDQSSNITLSALPSNATLTIAVDVNELITFIASVLKHISYLVSSLGFLLMFSSSMAIILSLCLNIRHIKPKAGCSRHQDAEACLKASVLHLEAAKAVSCIVGVNVVLCVAVNILTSASGGAIWTLAFSIANTIVQILSCLNLIKGQVNVSNVSICCFCNKKNVNEIEN